MINRTSFICLILAGSLLFTAASAMAISDERMLNRYRNALPKTINEYINVWVENRPKADFEKPLTKLLRQHAMLLAYGIDINDEILVAHLFEEKGKPVSLRVFAARLFFRRLNQEIGWKPDMTATLNNRHYRIKAHNISNPLAEDEFNLVLP